MLVKIKPSEVIVLAKNITNQGIICAKKQYEQRHNLCLLTLQEAAVLVKHQTFLKVRLSSKTQSYIPPLMPICSTPSFFVNYTYYQINFVLYRFLKLWWGTVYLYLSQYLVAKNIEQFVSTEMDYYFLQQENKKTCSL